MNNNQKNKFFLCIKKILFYKKGEIKKIEWGDKIGIEKLSLVQRETRGEHGKMSCKP